jgi:hypothetical protein
MFTRRGFLATGFLLGQAKPRLALVRSVPDGMTFKRAYSACPGVGLKPFLTGVFPHAYASAEPAPLTRFFDLIASPGPGDIAIAIGAGGNDWSEPGCRVPLTIRFPGKLGMGSSEILISAVDVLPTVMGLAGLPVPEEVHGRDLSGMLNNGPPSVYAEGALGKADEWRMIVRGWDKMVTNTNLGPLHLFNLGLDAGEQEDLAQLPGNRLRVDELRALMLDWRRRTGDGLDRSGLKKRK